MHCLARNPFLHQPCSLSGVFCVLCGDAHASPPSHPSPKCSVKRAGLLCPGAEHGAAPGCWLCVTSALHLDASDYVGRQQAACAYLAFYFYCSISSRICCGYTLARCCGPRAHPQLLTTTQLGGEKKKKKTGKPLLPCSHQGQGWVPAGGSSGRRVSARMLKAVDHWPQRAGSSLCSSAVPGGSHGKQPSLSALR